MLEVRQQLLHSPLAKVVAVEILVKVARMWLLRVGLVGTKNPRTVGHQSCFVLLLRRNKTARIRALDNGEEAVAFAFVLNTQLLVLLVVGIKQRVF